jgi:chaperonin GroEL
VKRIVAGGGVLCCAPSKLTGEIGDNAEDAGIKLVLKPSKRLLRARSCSTGGEEPLWSMAAGYGWHGNYGYNAANETYGDMIDMGILDHEVTRTALQNAASVASLMLTTECMIAETQDDAAGGGGMGGMGGGMGGMGIMGM